jgi:WD40 repeat protein
VHRLAGHSGWVWGLASLGDGLLASASEDGSIRLWDAISGTCTYGTSPERGPVHALARLDGGHLVAGFADGHLIVYAIDARNCRLDAMQVVAAHRGEVYAVCAAGDGFVASAGEDGYARVFRLSGGGTCMAALPHGGFVRTLARLNEQTLVSGSYDATLRIWRWTATRSG